MSGKAVTSALYTPIEKFSLKAKTPQAGLLALVLCVGGLGIELSRQGSIVGWGLRKVHDGLRPPMGLNWNGVIITDMGVDIVIRTVIGEAALEPEVGKIAVAHVILNRARQNIYWYGGNRIENVAMHKAVVKRPTGIKTVWQFEPWMSRRDYLWSIGKHSRIYLETQELVRGCLNGTHRDPTFGATHFLEPNIVRSRTGGTLPKWAQGEGRKIGRHVFFKHERPTL